MMSLCSRDCGCWQGASLRTTEGSRKHWGAATQKFSLKQREGPGLRADGVSKFLILYPAVTLLILVSQWENTCFAFENQRVML